MLEFVQMEYTTKVENLKDFILVAFVLVSDLHEKNKLFLLCDFLVIDSLPLPVCKFGWAHFHKTF